MFIMLHYFVQCSIYGLKKAVNYGKGFELLTFFANLLKIYF
jgi:hypothetical protein